MTTSLLDPPATRPGRPSTAPERARRLLRGRADDPVWARPALLALLLATAVLYLWGLGASGWANAYYSAAAQAGAASWKALFFGSLDAANSITVDKAPAALWVMGLSVRLFGLSSWSILVPQALMGVATVGVLYATVRRWFGPAAGLLAGAVMALTPVATLMFRFNNPDALLVLLLTGAAYALVRALERAGTRWLVLAGSLVGFAFLAKMLQALLVVPAFALVYLAFAPAPLRRRLGQIALAGAAMVASAGWWLALVELIPDSMRPYVGGSQSNSILELTLGYNGLGRLTGEQIGSVGGGPGGGWGATGWTRLLDGEIGGQIAWLVPAALIALVAGLWVTRRAGRTDQGRAAFALWGGWLLVTGLVFSFMQGIFHAYYTVALAPAVAALVGMGATLLWRLRDRLWASLTLAAAVAVTALWSNVLLARAVDWSPWLRVLVVLTGLGAAAVLAAGTRIPRQAALPAVAVALAAVLAGPLAWSLQTAATPHTGAIVTAGPAVASTSGPGGGPGGQFGGGPGGQGFRGGQGGFQGMASPQGFGQGGRGGMGGLLDAGSPSTELISLLEQGADGYTWVAAAVGANNAAGYQLATELPVMAIGGFNGSDPSPTLAQFQQYVAEGKVHYFLGGAGMRSNGGSDDAQEIAAWVADNFTSTTVGGTTLYDLTTAATGASA